MVDEGAFKQLMGAVCAPVTVVTAMTAAGLPHGATVSSFASLSLRPAMVSFALDRDSELLRHIRESGRIGVNVLRHGQADVAVAFAGRAAARFEGVVWRIESGVPRLVDAGGWMTGDVASIVPGGDHLIVLADVTAAETADAPPLVYARRTFGTHSEFLQPSLTNDQQE